MKPVNQQAWESAADDVLTVLMNEEYVATGDNYFNWAMDTAGLAIWHMPPGKRRSLLRAIHDLRIANKAVNWQTVAAVADGTIEQSWYMALDALCDEFRLGRVFRDNVGLLIEYGETMGIVDTLQGAVANLKTGCDRETEVGLLMSSLTRLGGTQIVNETAAAAADEFDDFLNQAPAPIATTGIKWIDELTNGFMPARLWYIAGPYKSRKTTIAYNMALSAVRAGQSVAVLSLENQKRTVVASFVAMLAFEWLYARHAPYTPDDPLFWISAGGLLKAQNSYHHWKQTKVQAIDYGRAAFRKIADRLRIYDASKTGGSLSTSASVRRVIYRDKRLYDGQVFFVDHMGQMNKQIGDLFSRVSFTSNDFQALSREDAEHPITLVVLAQLNEETIKGDESYSAGVKGGGDPSADADHLLTTKPVSKGNGDFYNDRTMLKMKFNRWGAMGQKEEVLFHTESGLIMQPEQPRDTSNL